MELESELLPELRPSETLENSMGPGGGDPKTLAAPRDRRCMASEEEIVHSLQGVWKPDALFELQQAVDAYDFYRQQIAKCDEQLKQYLALCLREEGKRSTRRPPT